MFFLQALRSALLGTFDFSGRSDRLEQWTFTFLTAFVVVAIYVSSHLGASFGGPMVLVLVAGAAWMMLAHISLFVRRLHDNNRSGLYMLIPAAAVSVWIAGWLGMNGYIGYYPGFFF